MKVINEIFLQLIFRVGLKFFFEFMKRCLFQILFWLTLLKYSSVYISCDYQSPILFDVIITHVKPQSWFELEKSLSKFISEWRTKYNVTLSFYKPIAGDIGDIMTYLHFGKLE